MLIACGESKPGEPTTPADVLQPHDVDDTGDLGCSPKCGEKQCGDDGCGAQCGTCAVGQFCDNGLCSTVPVCLAVRPLQLRVGTPTPSSVALFFAVDTCEGEPVPGLADADFEVFEDGKQIPTFESDATILTPAVEIFVSLVVDMSGSMEASGVLPEAIEAMKSFATTLMTEPGAAVWLQVSIFNKDLEIWQEHTTDLVAVIDELDALHDYVPIHKTTNLYGALIDAIDDNGYCDKHYLGRGSVFRTCGREC